MDANDKRRRRRHSAVFKAEAVAACQVAGSSVAGIALERQINANLLRRWIKEAVSRSALVMSEASSLQEKAPAFLPVTITASKPTGESQRPIRVQVRKKSLRVTVEWPTTASGSCAAWLRELLS
jgi:transposase-like protein